ncbi:hypothetical protein KY334_01495 [Candidatus Woesearchaeota archaeon]|nr:hypothetical protein [Candidatus Woesearchaeota archaeon]
MISFGILPLTLCTMFLWFVIFVYLGTTEQVNKSTNDIVFKSLAIAFVLSFILLGIIQVSHNHGFQKGVESVELQKESLNNK